MPQRNTSRKKRAANDGGGGGGKNNAVTPRNSSERPEKKFELINQPIHDCELRVPPPRLTFAECTVKFAKGLCRPRLLGGTVVMDKRWLCPVAQELLTMSPWASPSAPSQPSPFSMMGTTTVAGKRLVTVPRGFALSLLPESALDPQSPAMQTPKPLRGFPKFCKTLRKHQAPTIKHLLQKIRTFPFHGILNAGCGLGKTTMLIYIACVLKVPTLVIVPDVELLKQWKQRIGFYCPGATVGIFSGVTNKKRAHGAFCIASLTTMSMISFDDADDATFLSHYGMCAVDECHKCCAKQRSDAMRNVRSHYVVGLSATLNRGDRLMHGIEYLMGPVLYRILYLCSVDVQRVKYVDPGFHFVPMRWGKNRNQCNFSATVSALVHNLKRTNCIARLVRYYRAEGRTVIVLSRMTQVLEDLHDIFGPHESGLVCGTATSREAYGRRALAKTKPILLGSEQLAATGLDKDDLDCLIIVTPMKGGKPEDIRADPRKSGGGCTLQQAAGRITRENPDKKWPILVDFYDGGPSVGALIHGLAKTRLRWYHDNKCEMMPELTMGPRDGAEALCEGSRVVPFPDAAALRKAKHQHEEEEEKLTKSKFEKAMAELC